MILSPCRLMPGCVLWDFTPSIVSTNGFNLLCSQCHNLLSKHHVQQYPTVCSAIQFPLIRLILPIEQCVCVCVCVLIQLQSEQGFKKKKREKGENTKWVLFKRGYLQIIGITGDVRDRIIKQKQTFKTPQRKIISLIPTCFLTAHHLRPDGYS